MLIDKRPKDSLIEFCKMCENILGSDKNKIYSDTIKLIKYYKSSKIDRESLRVDLTRENKWYKALKNGQIDYSIYSDDGFLSEMWACWIIYSRNYLRAIYSPKSLFSKSIKDDFGVVNKIVDLGCGFGYTTAALKEMYQDADVYGTNLENTAQIKICRFLADRRKFKIVTDIDDIGSEVDLLFASEYFEHILNPIDHLRDIIKKLNPKNMLIANAFNVRSVGHFNYYKIDEELVDQKLVSKIFNNELRKLGYKKIKTKLWNNRPNYYKLT